MSNAVLDQPYVGRHIVERTPIESDNPSTRAEGHFEELQRTQTRSISGTDLLVTSRLLHETEWRVMTDISLVSFTPITEPTPTQQERRAFLYPFESTFRTLRFVEPEISPQAIDPTDAAEDLRHWLNLTWDDLASITGIAKNTFHDWKRTSRVQRPSTVRKLLRVQALVRAVRARLGPGRAAEWFRTGPLSPLDLMLAGDLDAAEEAGSVLLFRREAIERGDRYNYSPFAPEPDFEVHVEPRPAPLRRAPRRPRRGRLPRP